MSPMRHILNTYSIKTDSCHAAPHTRSARTVFLLGGTLYLLPKRTTPYPDTTKTVKW